MTHIKKSNESIGSHFKTNRLLLKKTFSLLTVPYIDNLAPYNHRVNQGHKEEEQKTKKDGREKRRLGEVGQEKRQYIHITATGHEHKNHHKDKHTEIEACGKQLVGTRHT